MTGSINGLGQASQASMNVGKSGSSKEIDSFLKELTDALLSGSHKKNKTEDLLSAVLGASGSQQPSNILTDALKPAGMSSNAMSSASVHKTSSIA